MPTSAAVHLQAPHAVNLSAEDFDDLVDTITDELMDIGFETVAVSADAGRGVIEIEVEIELDERTSTRIRWPSPPNCIASPHLRRV